MSEMAGVFESGEPPSDILIRGRSISGSKRSSKSGKSQPLPTCQKRIVPERWLSIETETIIPDHIEATRVKPQDVQKGRM